MIKRITLALLCAACTFVAQGQKKKDLLDEVAQLKKEVAALNDSVSVTKRKANKSKSQAEVFEKENQELREANATLLKNLSSFSQLSKQNTETVNKALAALKKKEGQLKFITDDFSKNDSTAIVILTQAKNTLGQEAKVGVSDGDVVFSNKLDFLFGTEGATKLTPDAAAYLGKLGQIMVANPDRSISVEGLNITGEFGLTYQQAVAVATALIGTEGVKPETIHIMVKDGNFKEGVLIRLTSDSKAFYQKMKEEFK